MSPIHPITEMKQPEQIPFVLADPGMRLDLLPDEELDGAPHDMVSASYVAGVGDSPGDVYILYVNKKTGLVDAIQSNNGS